MCVCVFRASGFGQLCLDFRCLGCSWVFRAVAFSGFRV